MTSAGPLRLPRLVAYALLCCTSICVIGTSAWALAELNDKRDKLQADFPQGTLDAGDNVAISSVAVALASATLVTTLSYTLFAVVPKWHKHDAAKKALKVHTFYYGFMELAWFAVGVAAAVIVANRSADINVPGVPQGLLDQALEASGESAAYKDNNPSVAYTICIWLAFLFNTVVLALDFLAWRAAASPAVTNRDSVDETREVKA